MSLQLIFRELGSRPQPPNLVVLDPAEQLARCGEVAAHRANAHLEILLGSCGEVGPRRTTKRIVIRRFAEDWSSKMLGEDGRRSTTLHRQHPGATGCEDAALASSLDHGAPAKADSVAIRSDAASVSPPRGPRRCGAPGGRCTVQEGAIAWTRSAVRMLALM